MALCSSCGAPFTPAVPSQELCDTCAGLAPVGGPPSSFATVAGFRLTQQLGAGRFGASWLGEAPEGYAVVKLLHDLASDGEGVARFLAEAAKAAPLRGESVAGLLTAGALPEGKLFLVYEYGGDESLASVLRAQARLVAPRALEVCAEVAQGLQRGHEHGLLHGDLKAANVALWHDDAGAELARVLDLPTAQVLSRAGLREATPLPLSSAATTSPEAARGEPVDARSDLYALGVLLYQTLTGRLPVTGMTAGELLRSHREHRPLTLRDAGRKLPDELEAVIATLLAKRKEQRPSSALEVAQLLRSLLPLVDSDQVQRPPRAHLAPAETQLPGIAPRLLDERQQPSPAAAPAPVDGEAAAPDPDRTPPGGFLAPAPPSPTPLAPAPLATPQLATSPLAPAPLAPSPAASPALPAVQALPVAAEKPGAHLESDFDPDRTPPDPMLASVQELPDAPPAVAPEAKAAAAKPPAAQASAQQQPPQPARPAPPVPRAQAAAQPAPRAPAATDKRPGPGGTLPEMALATILEPPTPGGVPAGVEAARPRPAPVQAQQRPGQIHIGNDDDAEPGDEDASEDPEGSGDEPADADDPAGSDGEPGDDSNRVRAPSARPKMLRRRRGSKVAFSGPGHRATTLQRQLVKLGLGLVALLAILVGVAIFAMSPSEQPRRARRKAKPAAESAETAAGSEAAAAPPRKKKVAEGE